MFRFHISELNNYNRLRRIYNTALILCCNTSTRYSVWHCKSSANVDVDIGDQIIDWKIIKTIIMVIRVSRYDIMSKWWQMCQLFYSRYTYSSIKHALFPFTPNERNELQ